MARHTTADEQVHAEMKLVVAASAIVIWRSSAPEIDRMSKLCADTRIRIEGQSKGARYREARDTLLLVATERSTSEVVGYAHGGSTPWTVDCTLPHDQFCDLVAMVLADKLVVVEMGFDRLRWHKGTLLFVEFGTSMLPSESA